MPISLSFLGAGGTGGGAGGAGGAGTGGGGHGGAGGGAGGTGGNGSGGSGPVDRAVNYLRAVETNLQNKFPNIHFDGQGNKYRNGVLVKDADMKVGKANPSLKGPQDPVPGSEAPSQPDPIGVPANEEQVTIKIQCFNVVGLRTSRQWLRLLCI